MNIKFPALSDSQRGSSQGLVEYLEKEDKKQEAKGQKIKEYFFNHSRDVVPGSEVQKAIDNNIRKLGKADYKYYTFVISPSKEELKHIENNPEKIKEYTRALMDAYAKNFNKGIEGEDLMYFGKVEHSRQDRQTKEDKGEGNMHVHIIVSRRDQHQWHKISPYNNAKEEYETRNKIKSGGFNRNAFREASEKVFDNKFEYKRDLSESFKYQNTMKNGKFEDQVKLLEPNKEKEKEQIQEQKNIQEVRIRDRSRGLGL
jgi:hypothetical protein